jgi:predicted flap endonuclease-1-like 5' DNA nuclease
LLPGTEGFAIRRKGTVHETLLLKLTTLMMTTPFSIQAQAAEEGRGRWWLWIVMLLALSVVVAWLLGREVGRQEALTSSASRLAAEPQPDSTSASAPHIRLGSATAASPAAPDSPAKPVAEESKPAPVAGAATVATPESGRKADTPDDLTEIDGIGPKIKSVLQAAGIATFADLANADAAHLKQILVDAGLQIHNPSTWPEQAVLAGAGRWEDLKALKSQLHAGRRQ